VLNTLSSASPSCPSAQTTHAIFDGLAAMLSFLAGAQGAELLQFPKLCRLFFMTVSYVISELPLSLIHLPPELYHTLLRRSSALRTTTSPSRATALRPSLRLRRRTAISRNAMVLGTFPPSLPCLPSLLSPPLSPLNPSFYPPLHFLPSSF
jgi:hypothetical protein